MLMPSKMRWVAVLYFAQGLPYGVVNDVLPIWFRQQGVDLRSIGAISLLGLAWTLKFLWAPAVDHYRQHRWWMAGADLAMGAVMLAFAASAGVGPWVWAGIALFTLLSATNDIAIDGYTVELLGRGEVGLANGLRAGFYRVGLIASGVVLMAVDWFAWSGAFASAAVILFACAFAMRLAPAELAVERPARISVGAELRGLRAEPRVASAVVGFALAALLLVDQSTHWLRDRSLWPIALGLAAGVLSVVWFARARPRAEPRRAESQRAERQQRAADPRDGPLFGALLGLLERPHIGAVIAFILLFKLGDASMGFMVKPFWVDAGFTAGEIGLVSVNLGPLLSAGGAVLGGIYIHRAGIFTGLWVLGLLQAASNLGYALAAWLVPHGPGSVPELAQRALVYGASGLESFTGGLGTAAFLAFLMALVEKRRSATEYALLSSIFALSRSVAGWAGGFGAEAMGYAGYFLFTFFLSFPAYALLPAVRRALAWAEQRAAASVQETPIEGVQPQGDELPV